MGIRNNTGKYKKARCVVSLSGVRHFSANVAIFLYNNSLLVESISINHLLLLLLGFLTRVVVLY